MQTPHNFAKKRARATPAPVLPAPAQTRRKVTDNNPPGVFVADAPAVDAAHGWTLEPHICRVCHSRMASRRLLTVTQYQCTNCGAEATGQAPSVMCCCGMKLRRPTASGRTGAAEVDAGVRCMRNPSPTPEFPSLYVAADST